jgi:tetratricopeptide (TPR) repeat protein
MILKIVTGVLVLIYSGICLAQQSANDAAENRAYKSELNSNAVLSAEASYLRQDWQASANEFRKLVLEYPKNTHFAFRLGNSAAQLGNLEEAVRAYEAVLRVDGEDTRTLYNLALIRLLQAENGLLRVQTNPAVPTAMKEDIQRALEAARALLRPSKVGAVPQVTKKVVTPANSPERSVSEATSIKTEAEKVDRAKSSD